LLEDFVVERWWCPWLATMVGGRIGAGGGEWEKVAGRP
jgi:hypothetical protein